MKVRSFAFLLISAFLIAQTPEMSKSIYDKALISNEAYRMLDDLTLNVGHRLSGSENFTKAMAWGVAQLKAKGFVNVRIEKVMSPRWVRGKESIHLISPRPINLTMLGIGMSIGTPKEGITAEVVIVDSFEHLDKLGEQVKNKIVLFDTPFVTYDKSVSYRSSGASRAAQYGAMACLVRSAGSSNSNTPHTGTLSYDPRWPKIPAAALSLEHAALLRRMSEANQKVIVRLNMEAEQLSDVEEGNVIGEIMGSKNPKDIIVLSGHLDSWDVGQGAQDDGAGCVIAIGAASLLKQMNIVPERTIRVILFANEENGVAGGRSYRDQNKLKLTNHIALLESDSGNGRITGFTLDLPGRPTRQRGVNLYDNGNLKADPGLLDRFQSLAKFQEVSGAKTFTLGMSGVDVSPMVEAGSVGIGARHDMSKYFDVHHTEADTFDKIIKEDLQHNVGCVAILAYTLSFASTRLQ
ncbi:MAG: M20/M25/M40 family metallo-hydrolase [Holophagaceae bacterium]